MQRTKGEGRAVSGGWSVLLLVAVAFAGGGCAEREQQATDGLARDTAAVAGAPAIYGSDPVENGRISYVNYCASCHGTGGRGDGPVAAALTTPLPDLTQLQASAGGTFPADSVYVYIDGREDVEAHGTREMPVWGNIWIEQDGQPVLQEQVDQRIRELVEYIRSLQAPAS